MHSFVSALRRPPTWPAALAITAVLLLLMLALRLLVYPDRITPLSYALPLLIALWPRDRWLLWTLAVCFLALSTSKLHWILPEDYFDVARQRNQVRDFIVMNVVAIVLCPCDSKAIGTASTPTIV